MALVAAPLGQDQAAAFDSKGAAMFQEPVGFQPAHAIRHAACLFLNCRAGAVHSNRMAAPRPDGVLAAAGLVQETGKGTGPPAASIRAAVRGLLVVGPTGSRAAQAASSSSRPGQVPQVYHSTLAQTP